MSKRIETFKGMAAWIEREFGRAVASETVRSWVYRYGMRVERLNGRAGVAEDYLREFVQSRIATVFNA